MTIVETPLDEEKADELRSWLYGDDMTAEERANLDQRSEELADALYLTDEEREAKERKPKVEETVLWLGEIADRKA